MHCVDLGESFQTHIYLKYLASIQPRMSPSFSSPVEFGKTDDDDATESTGSAQPGRPRRPAANEGLPLADQRGGGEAEDAQRQQGA